MSASSDVDMEEISLVDENRDTVEYKVLMAYAQRRLSVSKYRELLGREAKTWKGSPTERGERNGIPQAGKSEMHQEPSTQNKVPVVQCKKQRKKSLWRCLLLPSCARGKREEAPQELAMNQDTVNGLSLKMPLSGQPPRISSPEAEGEADDFLHVADKLAEIVSARSQPAPQRVNLRALERTPSLEEDGPLGFPPQEGDEKDEEERIIETIVALLRQTGDKLEETLKQDRTFYSRFTEMLSYAFFKKVTDQYLEEVPQGSIKETEDQIQCTKAAFVMDVTTRLTAVENHPMNVVLGFGAKYLQEQFSPWIQKHGGWRNAVGLLDQEEVE